MLIISHKRDTVKRQPVTLSSFDYWPRKTNNKPGLSSGLIAKSLTKNLDFCGAAAADAATDLTGLASQFTVSVKSAGAT